MVDSVRPRNQSILVTGGAGFIGSHLVNTLLEDNEIIVLDDGSTGRLTHVPDKATLITADIRNENDVRETIDTVDLIYHLAAVVSVKESITSPRKSHSINVDGTLNVLEAARDEDARVVTTSSAAIYGEPASVPISEDAPKRPRSPYGVEKLATDHYTRRYHDLYGLDTVVLRPFNVFGPGQTGEYAGVISTFIKQANAGEPITVHGDGTQTRDFVHVEDVVTAFQLAGTTKHTGEPFNVGTGQGIPIRLLAETIKEITESDSNIVYTEPRAGDIERSCADISNGNTHLDFQASVDLETGLESIIGSR